MMHGHITSRPALAHNISKVTQNFSAVNIVQNQAGTSHLETVEQIHARALEISSRYKRAEADLIDILQQAEEHRVYLKRGHASLFQYVVDDLGFAESTAYSLITVARKSRQVPELKAHLQSGTINLSNARRIASVLTPQNQSDWLSKASSLSSRQLEKEIVKFRPREATRERASYVNPNRIKLELGLSEREMLRLRRVQDLMSQTQKRALSLEEVLESLNTEYLRRHDPVEKAKRHRVRRAAPSPSVKTSDNSKNSMHSKSLESLTSKPVFINPSNEMGKVKLNPTKAVKTLVTWRIEAAQARASSLESPQRQSKVTVNKREPIPAAVLHQVNLRDQRRCTHIKRDGTRCNQARWIEIHHITPVSQGGLNTLSNLATLCSTHHKFAHL